MKHPAVKILALLLLLTMALSLVACKDEDPDYLPNTDDHKTADQFGIVQFGFISEKSFPASDSLSKWFKKAGERTEVTNSLFCAYDEASGRWYCWLYVGTRGRNDALEITVDDVSGCNVYLNLISASLRGETGGAYAFSVPGAAEPSFSFYIDGVGDGLVVTIGTEPVIPEAVQTNAA